MVADHQKHSLPNRRLLAQLTKDLLKKQSLKLTRSLLQMHRELSW
jgi:hypothetical protein